MTELRRSNDRGTAVTELLVQHHHGLLRCVGSFAEHFRLSPDRLGPEHIRQYQLFLVQRRKVSWASSFNQTGGGHN
jgi:hypothetical protein